MPMAARTQLPRRRWVALSLQFLVLSLISSSVYSEIQPLDFDLDTWNVPEHEVVYIRAGGNPNKPTAGIDLSGVTFSSTKDDRDSVFVPRMSVDVVIIPVFQMPCQARFSSYFHDAFHIEQTLGASDTVDKFFDESPSSDTCRAIDLVRWGIGQQGNKTSRATLETGGQSHGFQWCSEVQNSMFDDVADEFPTEPPPNSRLIYNQKLIHEYNLTSGVADAGKTSILWNIPLTSSVSPSRRVYPVTESGYFLVVFSNCDSLGRRVQVSGSLSWYNDHYQYLPAELMVFWYPITLLLLIYGGMTAWFVYEMYRNSREKTLSVETTVAACLCLGTLEMLMYALDFAVWNHTGHRSWFLLLSTVLLRCSKQAVTLSLLLIISIGQGVIAGIILLGTMYILLTACTQLLYARQYLHGTDVLSMETVDIGRILSILVFLIQGIFAVWMLVSLHNTTTCLQRWNKTGQLQRYLQFRSVLLVSMMIAVAIVALQIHGQFFLASSSFAQVQHGTTTLGFYTSINYLFITVSIAVLWKPDPDSHEYSYVMMADDPGDHAENDQYDDQIETDCYNQRREYRSSPRHLWGTSN
jgi:Lung seven transmembrane receptor